MSDLPVTAARDGAGLAAYAGRTVVVKYGGNAMSDGALKQAFATDVATLRPCSTGSASTPNSVAASG